MGKAKIIKHVEDGKYNVQLQYNNTAMDAKIATLTDNIAQYDIDIAAKQAEYDNKDLEYLSLIDTLVWITNTAEALAYQADTVYPAKFELDELKIALDTLLLQRESSESELAALQAEKQRLEETVEAWCLEYNEDLTADAMVGTVEVDYELPKIANQRNWPVVIKPDAWTANDGELQSVVAMDKWAHLYNRILSVPMMLIAPRYRVGIVTANDGENLTVELLAAQSQERLDGYIIGHDINAGLPTILSGLAVDYLTCGAKAFEIDDAVIVRFPPVNLYAQIRDKYLGLVADAGTKIDDANTRLAGAQANVAAKQGEYDDLLAEQDSYIAIINNMAEPQEVRDAASEYIVFLTPLVAAAYNAVTNAQNDVATVEIEIQSLTTLQTQYQVIADTNSAKSDAFVMTPTEKTVVGFADNPRECPTFALYAASPSSNNGAPLYPFLYATGQCGHAAAIDEAADMIANPSRYKIEFNNDGTKVAHTVSGDRTRWLRSINQFVSIFVNQVLDEPNTPVAPGIAFVNMLLPASSLTGSYNLKIYKNDKLASDVTFTYTLPSFDVTQPTVDVTQTIGHYFGTATGTFPGIYSGIS
jgi:hypothetical protein